MPLTAASTTYLHVLQNLSLILLSIFAFPLLTNIAILSQIISPWLKTPKHIAHHRKWRELSSGAFRPRTVLVTGISMSKGLALARAFYRAGHIVIGADFEPHKIPVAGHFSKAVKKFYRLPIPNSDSSSDEYIETLAQIVKDESVELWVSVSGEASALEDGEAAEVISKETDCQVVQFGLTLTETLHDKFSFIANTKKLSLNVPVTHLVTSETEALTVIYPEKTRLLMMKGGTGAEDSRRYIMKSVIIDDTNRADMTLLPRPTLKETEAHVKRLNPTPFRPFVLQQFVSGREYCAHSLILNGEVKAFVACPSAELLMHYEPLSTNSALSRAMLMYTEIYAKRTGEDMTGHFSIDFLVEEHVAVVAESKFDISDAEGKELMGDIYPIECNPRANTAVVLFADEFEDLADVYLSICSPKEQRCTANGHRVEVLVTPNPSIPGYYWIGHDLVTRFLLPVFRWTTGDIKAIDVAKSWMEFINHIIYWRDGTYEVWDPWPAWWLYVGYWPARFTVAIFQRKWWSRINVSTTKMFHI